MNLVVPSMQHPDVLVLLKKYFELNTKYKLNFGLNTIDSIFDMLLITTENSFDSPSKPLSSNNAII